MNDKFFSLPIEKQQTIMNAGYRVFSQNSYKKSPMSEIAGAAGISKSLLFHYFVNKKEFYLFLWKKSATISKEYMTKYKCYEVDDMFEIMLRGLKAKAQIIREYPELSSFVMKAYYEKDPEISVEIQKSSKKITSYRTNASLMRFDPGKFIPGLDLKMMYQTMYWASEGYLWEKEQSGTFNADDMERDFVKIIEFWKKIYLKNPENE